MFTIKRKLLVSLMAMTISPVIFAASVDKSKIPLSVSYTPDGLTFSALNNAFSTTLSGFIQAGI